MEHHSTYLPAFRIMGLGALTLALAACSWRGGGGSQHDGIRTSESAVKPSVPVPAKIVSPFLEPPPNASPPPLADDGATTKPGNPAAWGEGGRVNVGRSFEPVYFDPGSDELDGTARGRLADHARWLADHPNVWIALGGYCDASETARYGYNLAMSRALAVRQYLIGQGLAAQRLYPIGYGSQTPAVQPDGRQRSDKLNNRVELVGYIPPGGAQTPKPASATPSPAPPAQEQIPRPEPTQLIAPPRQGEKKPRR